MVILVFRALGYEIRCVAASSRDRVPCMAGGVSSLLVVAGAGGLGTRIRISCAKMVSCGLFVFHSLAPVLLPVRGGYSGHHAVRVWGKASSSLMFCAL